MLYFVSMNTAQSPTRQKFPLSSRKVAKKTLAATLGWIIFVAIIAVVVEIAAGAGSSVSAGTRLAIALGFVVFLGIIVLITYLYQRWYFAVYFYDLGENYIVIKKGPITPHEITIPYERIQDVYVDQDLLDRFFGLYDVHLSSATAASGMEAHIDGVEKAASDGLKDLLLSTVHQKLNKKQTITPPATSI